MEISQKTKDLIDRMCRNVERRDFTLEKEKAEEALMKTYDLFGLSRPKKVVWLNDIFEDKFQENARNAWNARSALDYDFDYFVIEHEYTHNRKDNPGEEPNKNDKKYLEYSELLMQAKEHGMGYRVEYEDTLYCVPTPLVLLDTNNRFHSDEKPAMRWKGGAELYYLHGVKLEKDMWNKIINKELSGKEIMALENMEQRMVALKYMNADAMLATMNAELINSSMRGNWLYRVPEGIFSTEAYFLKYTDPSTGRVYISGVDPEVAKQGNADMCMGWKFGLAPEQYEQLTVEA